MKKTICFLKSKLGAVLVVSAVALAAFRFSVQAQPYFTNTSSGTFYGAQQYNQNLAAPYNPSYVIQRQLQDGIMSGVFNSGTNGGGTAITNTYQNAFGTFTNYSTAPAVYLQAYNPTPGALQPTNQVLFATTTNFAIYFGGASNVNYSLTFIGH